MSLVHFAQSVRQHRDIPLNEINRYPDLATALHCWQQTGDQGIPREVDPLSLPRALLPYVMLLDLEENPSRLRVRLAGTQVCEKYGAELKGLTTDDFFSPQDAQCVVDAALKVAHFGIPSLAERQYVNLDGGLWSYVRLIAPLSRDGTKIDGFFKVLDPATLYNDAAVLAAE
ncbi:MAG: PAS domain-containing protein [Rhodospirillaceae bacterium]|nr:PAS domain-containing protein [Rhodospirillaceae bacterium]